MENLYTVKEVSRILKTNEVYVRDLIKAGLLTPLILGRIKIRESTLDNFLRKWEGWDLTDPIKPRELNVNNSCEGERK